MSFCFRLFFTSLYVDAWVCFVKRCLFNTAICCLSDSIASVTDRFREIFVIFSSLDLSHFLVDQISRHGNRRHCRLNPRFGFLLFPYCLEY